MSIYLKICWLTLRNRILEESRYPLQFMTNYVSFFLMGVLLALGSIAVQGGGTVEVNTAGFFLAFMAGGALSLATDVLSGNKTRLEEFYLKPLPSIPYLLAVAIGRSVETVPTLVLFVFALSVFNKSSLGATLQLAIIGFPVFFSMWGLGLLLAGVRLVFHKIGSLPQILWLVLLGTALAAPTSTLKSLAHLSPFAGGLLYLRTGQIDFLSFSVSCLMSLIVGVLAFLWGERTMLRRGLIAQE
jgi:hypothetical protein